MNWRHAGWLLLAVSMTAAAAERPEVMELRQRLAALQTHPEWGRMAAYEQVRAQQAVDALSRSRQKDRDTARYLAERRVEIAEI
ncbi:MAG: hypothetical protein LBV45_09620, partial [Xanthomonadaceae bacterium]|nr:hypothetical protein [Xanthomonadaceae bacterium]